MELLLGLPGYLLLMRYVSFWEYHNIILIMLFISGLWSLLVDFFCTYQMVKPIRTTIKNIVLFVISLKIIEFFFSFIKFLLPLVVGSSFLLVTQGQGSKQLGNLFSLILILLMTIIYAVIKTVVAQSYFTSLSRKRIIKWMLIASFVGFFLPHYIGSFYFKHSEKELYKRVKSEIN